MTDPSRPPTPIRTTTPTRISPAGQERVAERQARQAEALRANLRRRKEQVRAREEQASPGEVPSSEEL